MAKIRSIWTLCFGLVLACPGIATLGQGTGEAGDMRSGADPRWLATSRQVIDADAQADGVRLARAMQLIQDGSDASASLVTELLIEPTSPGTRGVLARAIRQSVMARPVALAAGWVDPLFSMIKSPIDESARQAGAALACFPAGRAQGLLIGLAEDRNNPEDVRLLAIETLGSMLDRRDVVGALVGMLDANDALYPQIMSTLAGASRVDPGPDVSGWRNWWAQESLLSDEQWLRSRMELRNLSVMRAQARVAAVEQERTRLEEHARRDLEEALREVFRLMPDERERERLLGRWLAHESPRYRLMAVTLIKERIPEGVVPSDALHNEIRSRLWDDSPEVRRLVLSILGGLRDPDDLDSIIRSLAMEQDPTVREILFRTLGLFQDPRAISVLLGEIEHNPLPAAQESEALLALGTILGRHKPESGDDVARLKTILIDRMQSLPSDAVRRRRGVLVCMAAIPEPLFTESFRSALDSESAELLIPAMEGLTALRDRSGIERMIELLRHPDPGVRKAAVTGLATLDPDPSIIEKLTSMCDARNEAAESVRDAAWTAVRLCLDNRSVEEQWTWVEHLPDSKERQVEYLAHIVECGAGRDDVRSIYLQALRMLAEALDGLNRHSEAVSHWKMLYDALRAEDQELATETGILLVADLIRSETTDGLSETLCQLLGDADADQKTLIITTVISELDKLVSSGRNGQADAVRALLDNESNLPCRELWVATLAAGTTYPPESS